MAVLVLDVVEEGNSIVANQPTRNGGESGRSSGEGGKGGRRRYFRRRKRKTDEPAAAPQKERPAASSPARRSSAKSNRTSKEDKAKSTSNNNRPRRRRRRSRQDQPEIVPVVTESTLDTIAHDYVAPQAVFIYTHVSRPTNQGLSEYRADHFTKVGRRLEDFNIDLAPLFDKRPNTQNSGEGVDSTGQKVKSWQQEWEDAGRDEQEDAADTSAGDAAAEEHGTGQAG